MAKFGDAGKFIDSYAGTREEVLVLRSSSTEYSIQ
jgi:hypothetical protein